ncbi:YvrJ protein family protein [compost metagenome]
MEGLDVSAITQLGFSVAVCIYLLTTFSKRIEALSKHIETTQSAALVSANETKEMFAEIRELIKEVCVLIRNTSESVRLQSALTQTALDRLEEYSLSNFMKNKEE